MAKKTRMQYAEERLDEATLLKFKKNLEVANNGCGELPCDSFRDAIMGSFIFHDTPEGREFWLCIALGIDPQSI